MIFVISEFRTEEMITFTVENYRSHSTVEIIKVFIAAFKDLEIFWNFRPVPTGNVFSKPFHKCTCKNIKGVS